LQNISGCTLGATCQKNHTTVSPGLVYRDADLIEEKSNHPTANFGALRTYQIGAQTVMCDTYSATFKGNLSRNPALAPWLPVTQKVPPDSNCALLKSADSILEIRP